MTIVNEILTFIISILDSILPSLNLSTEFLVMADKAVVWLVNLLESVSFFIPLDVFVLCWVTMITIDIFVLGFRLVQFILKLVRG